MSPPDRDGEPEDDQRAEVHVTVWNGPKVKIEGDIDEGTRTVLLEAVQNELRKRTGDDKPSEAKMEKAAEALRSGDVPFAGLMKDLQLIHVETEGGHPTYVTPEGRVSVPLPGNDASVLGSLRTAMEQLLAMAPRHAVVYDTGEARYAIAFHERPGDGTPAFDLTVVPVRGLTAEEEDVLQGMKDAQCGRYKDFGFFRMDPELADQNLYNCPLCAYIFRVKTARPPSRCPACHREINAPEARIPLTKDTTEEIGMKPEEELAKLLGRIAEEYDFERLNIERDPEENAKVLQMLARAGELAVAILNEELGAWLRRTFLMVIFTWRRWVT